jgi:hypothetical protein
MKVFNTDGSVLMEVQSLACENGALVFTGLVMGAMPVKGRLTPAEARRAFRLVRGWRLWWFVLTLLLRR